MQKVLLVAVAILFALGVLTSYQKHILDYRVSAITEIEFGQASAIEHREYLLRSCQSGVWHTFEKDTVIVTNTSTSYKTPNVTAMCPYTKKLTGGGGQCSSVANKGYAFIWFSGATSDRDWTVGCDTTINQDVMAKSWAICQ